MLRGEITGLDGTADTQSFHLLVNPNAKAVDTWYSFCLFY